MTSNKNYRFNVMIMYTQRLVKPLGRNKSSVSLNLSFNRSIYMLVNIF